jgi:hypothetical protein
VNRRRGLLTLFGLICTSFVALLPTSADAAQSDLLLIAQNFNIAADGVLTATVALPASLGSTDMSTAVFAVTVGHRIDKREDLAPIIADGTLSRPDDTVPISPLCCPGPLPGQYTLSVPLESTEVRPDALSIPRAGLYPISIEVQRAGKSISTVLTFINRLPAPDEATSTAALSVAFAIGTHSEVHLDSKGVTSLDNASTIAEMTSLADTLDALDASTVQSTVHLEPAVLQGLQQLDPTLFNRLVTSLQHHQVVAETQWPLDASQSAAANQQSLYTSWLRDGQDQLSGLGLGPSVMTRATIFADTPISAGGATLRRDLGAALMVVTPDLYDSFDGTIYFFSDNKGELVPAQLPTSTFDMAVIDHGISDLLATPLATPEMTRIYTVANLLALRQGIEIAGEDVDRRSVVIGTPDLGVPDASLLGPITALIAATPGLKAATLDDVSLRTEQLLIDDVEHPVTLPEVGGTALATRVFKQATLNNEIDGVASMLPDDSDEPQGWHDLANLLPTTALAVPDADEMISTTQSQLTEVRDAVQVPEPYTVNLAGKTSTVRIRFVNNSDVALRIKVELTSPSGKLVFANDPNPVELPPGVPTNVPIQVEARSNGVSGVSLDVSMPNDEALVPTIPLTVRVRALGVGNVITIALFVLVMLWWSEHWRSTRRKRRQAVPDTLPAS